MKARHRRLRSHTALQAGWCLLAITSALALTALAAAPAEASEYKMVMCAGNNGVAPYITETNTASPANPGGIFEFHNWCGGAGGDPPGENAFLRINENQTSGYAAQGAFGRFIWDVPTYIAWRAAGGYTRENYIFNPGWRAHLWMVDYANNAWDLLTQGSGLPNSGTQWDLTANFGPHLWPYSTYLDFHRYVFELECVRPEGCDRSGYNAVDANGFVFILNDVSPSQVALTTTSPFMAGEWSRGTQSATYSWSDLGSGIRFERVRIDGADRFVIDHQALGECNTSSSQVNGQWARAFQPCTPASNIGRSYTFDTASLSDGTHQLQACTQDFGQYQGLNGSGGESCDQRTVRTDNTPPGAPSNLEVTSANPARYLQHFAAHWTLPPNEGSPIARVHYEIVDAAGNVVTPEQSVSGTNLSNLPDIEGPAQAGDYRLRLWLEDSVGFSGPAAVAAIPHDTTPPAAPQDLSVAAPTVSRASEGFDVRWRDITDAGSPIAAVHYEVLDGSGRVAVPTQTVVGETIQAIPDLETPTESGEYSLKMWLSDAEANVGAPVSVPLAYDCPRSQVKSGTVLGSGLGEGGSDSEVVQEGDGSDLHGALHAADGAAAPNATLCVFSRVVTDPEREFLGLAMTGRGGTYRFAITPGASRQLSVVYRPDHRELVSHATIETVVHPVLKAARRVVYNKHFAHFSGQIPGPDNNRVVIVLQARVGRGWTAFRRYRTRDNGRFSLAYRFRHTYRRTRYVMRAQVRQTVGYPYLQGNSRRLKLLVVPKPPKRRR